MAGGRFSCLFTLHTCQPGRDAYTIASGCPASISWGCIVYACCTACGAPTLLYCLLCALCAGFRERLLADPSFLVKLGIEVGIGICTKCTAEYAKRQGTFGKVGAARVHAALSRQLYHMLCMFCGNVQLGSGRSSHEVAGAATAPLPNTRPVFVGMNMNTTMISQLQPRVSSSLFPLCCTRIHTPPSMHTPLSALRALGA